MGTMLTVPSPEVSEILAGAGFDWLFIDGEHGPFSVADIREVLRAVAGRADCLVRVPAIDEVPIKQALDLGATGVIVPQVNLPEQAARVVDWCRYPPQGARGMGLARAHGYGTRTQEYCASANDQVTVVIQAEHRTAVENINAIADVPGIDAVLIGPNDLAASYGKPGEFEDPQILEAIGTIQSACQAAGLPLGFFGATAEAVRPYVDRGFNLIVVGVDVLLIGGAAKAMLDEVRV